MPRPALNGAAPTAAFQVQNRKAFTIRPAVSTSGEPTLQKAAEVRAPEIKEEWHQDAYAFAEAIAEVGYAFNLKASKLSECRIRPEVRKEGTNEWVETDDPRVLRALAGFKGEYGGHGELLRQASIHMDIAGDCWLFGDPVMDRHGFGIDGQFLWEFLSTMELRVDTAPPRKGSSARTSAPTKSQKTERVIRNPWGGSKGRTGQEVEAYVARFHQRDPRFSQRADSAMRRVLPIARELVLLTQVIDALVKSRIPAGIFFVPEEISFGPTTEWEDPSNPDTGFDEFEEDLKTYATQAIEDRTSVGSIAPMLMRGPAMIDGKPTKELLGLIDMHRDLSTIYQELRQESLTRIAAGLDIPPEMISGKGRTNHWTSYNIDAEFIASHITPMGNKILEFVTVSYLRPMLQEFEGMSAGDAEWFRFSLDTAPIAADPDLSTQALAAYEVLEVSGKALRRRSGLGEDDAPDGNERKYRLLEHLLNIYPAAAPNLLPLLLPDVPGIDKAIKDWPQSSSRGGGSDQPEPAIPAARSGGKEPVPTPRPGLALDADTMGRLLESDDGTLLSALLRSLERAEQG